MTEKNDGGPAFPHVSGTEGHGPHVTRINPNGDIVFDCIASGMTLRDWFAGQSLAGILSRPKGCEAWDGEPQESTEAAYNYADAMIAERSK